MQVTIAYGRNFLKENSRIRIIVTAMNLHSGDSLTSIAINILSRCAYQPNSHILLLLFIISIRFTPSYSL